MSVYESLSRRQLLRTVFWTGGAVAGARFLSACSGDASSVSGPRMGDNLPVEPGPLSNLPPLVRANLDGLYIPEGFSVRAVARHLSNPLTGLPDPLGLTGYVWHQAPDGGAVFPAPDGGWAYVSNSEVGIGGATGGSSRDGGVGALRFNAAGDLVDAYRILDGTRRNCAGGSTPWNTWLSCEETGDGITYECDPFGTPDTARALPTLGIYNHEAACVDMQTRTIFLTEDAGAGRLYRFVADADDYTVDGTGQPRLRMERGRLQVMNVEGFENDGYIESDVDARLIRRTHWVDVVAPERPQAQVRNELAEAGAVVPGTRFRGGEGIWIHELPRAAQSVPPGGRVPTRALVYFASKGDNRVYAYDVDNELIQTIFDNEFIDPPFDDVDNVTVSPWGDVIVAEDGVAKRLIVVVPDRPAEVLLYIDRPGSELTGPAFTPDGSRLYFSSQRGPNLPILPQGTGVTYELTIPPAFRGV
jgi:hypothetical protein